MTSPLKTADAQSGALSNVIINNTEYDFNVILINPEGRYFVFRPEAIKDLTIFDTINQYSSNGYMIFDNSYDFLERPAIFPNTADPMEAQNVKTSYAFRGDSRDILRIQITPRLNPNNANPENDEKIKVWFTINHEFAIYNMEDVIQEAPDSKLRKIYFYDIYQQILSEKNVQFSTADIAPNVTPDSTDAQRSVKTGVALKALLNKTFPKSEGFNLQFIDFDEGSTDLFFTAPADYKAEDCLQYILERHVSSAANNYDACLLKIGRYPRDWSFMSIKQMFDQAYTKGQQADSGGPLFIERLILGGSGDDTINPNLQVTISRSPAISLYFADNNTIENFSFLPPAGEHTQKLITSKLVHSHRKDEKVFYIDSERNDFENTLKAYYDNYVKSMKGANDKPVSNLVSNRIRKQRQNVYNIFSTSEASPDQRLGVGRSKTLRDSIYHNRALTFRVKGATYRQAGLFISIDRNNSLTDCAFDDKLLGIYIIIDVRHTFIGNNYYNDLLCVKSYNFRDTDDQTGEYL
jgi:hypothetical protein